MSKKENVKQLFDKYGLYQEEIGRINYHFNVLSCNVDELLTKLVKDDFINDTSDLPEEVVANVLLQIIKRCDQRNPEYSPKLDEEMTRIGLKTDRFYSSLYDYNPLFYYDEENKYGEYISMNSKLPS